MLFTFGGKSSHLGVIFLVWDFDIQNLRMQYTVLVYFLYIIHWCTIPSVFRKGWQDHSPLFSMLPMSRHSRWFLWQHSCEFAALPKMGWPGGTFWRQPMWSIAGCLYAFRAAFHQVEVPCPFHGACECIACMTWSTSFRSLGCCVLAASTQQVNMKTC